MDHHIGLVGTGRLGTAIAGELFRRGQRIAAVVSRDPIRAHDWVSRYGTVVVDGNRVAKEVDVLILASPDDAVEGIAEGLSQFGGWEEKVVLHTSGSLELSVLASLEQAGAYTGSMHPLCSFVGDPVIPTGIFFGIEGSDPARQAAEEIVRLFEGIPFRLEPGTKALYHAAACMAANFIVTLADAASKTMTLSGLPSDMAARALMPLMDGVLQNIRYKGTNAALTGPIRRGDTQTIARHIAAIQQELPEMLPFYQTLSRATLDLALRAGLSETKRVELEEILGA